MSNRIYRILGGPKHGELIELESHQKTLTCVLPAQPTVYSSTVGRDDIYRVRSMEYEVALFSFPQAMTDVEVLVPKGSKEAEREQYLINLITGRGFNGNW